MTPAARLQAAVDILDALDRPPVDRHIREFFRARRYAGSKDRAAIAERVYDVLRHRAEFAWRMQGDSHRALVIASLLEEGADAKTLFTGDGYGPAALSDAEAAAIAHPPAGEMPPHVRGEYPQFLEPELERRFAGTLLAEMRTLTQRAPVDLRVNTLKAARAAVLRELCDSGFDAQATPFAPDGIRIPPGRGGALQQGRAFAAGAFEFQDEAAQLCAMLCGAAPGMRVLDLAAGAGGKSLALAAAMRNDGSIVACDIRPGILDNLRERAARAGASIIFARPADDLRDDERFDIVLVDAPCSGTGTWRRQPELRWHLTPARLAELNTIQDSLLDRAARHVKPGGRLVYATCSVLPCENEDRLAAFRRQHPSFAPLSAVEIWRGLSQAAPPPGLTEVFRATPLATGTDGFFTAALTRIPPPPGGYRMHESDSVR